MPDHPLLCTAEEVRALLDGRKTRVSMPVRFTGFASRNPYPFACPHPGGGWIFSDADISAEVERYAVGEHGRMAPWGEGDRLWVKETWTSSYGNGCWGTLFRADGAFMQGKRKHEMGPHFSCEDPPPWTKWRPSVHMPRWASRITLEVLSVKVERVQEITFAGIRSEGVQCPVHDFPGGFCCSECASLREEYGTHWATRHPRYPWSANPWIWVGEVRRV